MSPTQDSSPPYLDTSNGDLTIRTADHTDFHVHQCIISILSPVFADMFSLPKNPITSSPKPLVEVGEPGTVWAHILSFCYFLPLPSLAIDDVHALLEAARKYQMPRVTDWMRRTLLHELTTSIP